MKIPDAILSRLAAIPAAAIILVSAPAFGLTIADNPLFLTSAVKPNIMLMLDNSGSMNNIVPETPFDASTIYLATCTAPQLITAGSSVEIRIVSSGPRIRYSGSDYELGNATGKKCFDSAASYMAKLHADLGTAPSSYLPAQYTGNFLNWYFDPSNTSPTWSASEKKKPGTLSRLEIAKTAATGLVDALSTSVRVGFSTYNSGDGGSLREIIEDVTTAKKTSVKTKVNALTASGATPLAETLADIGRYFAEGNTTGKLTLHPATASPPTPTVAQVFNSHSIKNDSGVTPLPAPIQEACQKSFAMLLTDGRPQSDRAISSSIYDYTGDCAAGLCVAASNSSNLPAGPLTVASWGNGTKVGRSYETQGSDYLDDVAAALYEIDLRPDKPKTGTQKNNIVTYMIGFADSDVISDPLMRDAADQGGGLFLTAANSGDLARVFNSALSDIIGKVSSAAAVATNSTRLNTDTLVFQALFDSGDWSGRLIAYPLNADGTLGTAKWDTDTAGLIPAHDVRNIFTWNGSAKVPFTTASFAILGAAQQTALQTPTCLADATTCAKARIDWLRGDQSKETDKVGGIFRKRVKPLGDVVNSDPLFVSAENFGYIQGIDLVADQEYLDFLILKQGRAEMLYVGANDGMLHAFDADTGVEKFAYVPNGVFSKLSQLTAPAYSHTYFVDGPSYAADAYINTGDGLRWHTILVGTLGAGGRSVFALDITDPAAADFGKPLWEFTDADLGFNVGVPQIVKLADGQWAAIFGNGYNSDNHRAKLFIVNLLTGASIAVVDTGVGSAATPNGLGAPAVYDANNNRTIGDAVDAIYAGDLLGNVWKLGKGVSGWEVSYNFSGTPVPLFTARNGADTAQPITAPLEIGERPPGTSAGVMVYIGTGSYFTTTDNTVDNTANGVQSLYGIWDDGTRIASTNRSDLQQQTITHELTAFDEQLRVVSNNSVNYTVPPTTTQKRGWYMDLISPALGMQSERVVSTPLLRHGRVIFTTIIPSAEVCSFGGSSWLMELTAVTGGRLDYSVFDLYGDDNLFNDSDFVEVTIDGVPTRVPASGIKSKVGITKAPAVISAGDVEHKVQSGTDTTGTNKGVQVTKEKGSGGKSRTSWRQLFSEDK
jgi:Tfp pilus tip-associated adhesin PilY1